MDTVRRTDVERRKLLLFRKIYPFLQWLPGFVLLQDLDRRVRFANSYFRERFGDPGERLSLEDFFGDRHPLSETDPVRTAGPGTPREWEGTLSDGRTYKVYALPFTEEDGSSFVLIMGLGLPAVGLGAEDRRPGSREKWEASGRTRSGEDRRIKEAAIVALSRLMDNRNGAARSRREDPEGRDEALSAALRMGQSMLLETQRALSESHKRLQLVGKLVPCGIWTCDPDGRIRYANPFFLDLIGRTMDECRTHGWTDLLHPADAERTAADWRRCLETGECWDSCHRILGTHGRCHTVSARAMPLRDEEGLITGWVGVNHSGG
jgi:PAS domain S-box-containing protein